MTRDGPDADPRAAGGVRSLPRVPTVAALAVLALTLWLGDWQLRRADEKRALQAARDAAMRAAPLTIDARPIDPASLVGRRVAAQGRWLDERSVFLDNRTHGGRAGFHVFTPLALAGADGAAPMHLLVLRGWAPRDPRERTRLPPLPATAPSVRVEGIAQAAPAVPGGGAGAGEARGAVAVPRGEGEGGRIWQRVDLAAYAAWSGLPLQPVVVRQTGGDADALVREWAVPGDDVAKHLGYAVQWFAMAAATAALWWWFGWRPTRRPTAGRADAGAARAGTSDGASDGPGDGPTRGPTRG